MNTLPPHTVASNPHNKQLILPTEDGVVMFLADTEMMTMMDYDLDEVLSNLFVALTEVHEAEYRINGFYQTYLRWGEGKDTLGVPDGQILANAFIKLARFTLDLYKRIGMWDGTGFCPYYFVDRLGYDCVLGPLD